jgi:23S rRNA pseudouridine1911/1915/1917 synthase
VSPTEVTVSADEAGRRLDVVLAERLGLPRARIAARIRSGDVEVAGAPGKASQRVRAGDTVTVHADVATATVPAPAAPPIRYRDDHLVVVAKPAGLVVHPGAGHTTGTLVDALRAAGVPLAPAGGDDRPGIVHRLDRDTSGLLVVASTDAAYRGLVALLQRRAVTRRYLALVDGTPAAPTGRIEAPIGRDPRHRTRFATVPEGKPATTRYTTATTGDVAGRPVALLVCRLETGRTHQIRVHLEAIGHPVVGDPVYGPRPALAERLGLTRPFLHAARLAFPHPVTGEPVDLLEPLPEELLTAVAVAGVAAPDLTVTLGD